MTMLNSSKLEFQVAETQTRDADGKSQISQDIPTCVLGVHDCSFYRKTAFGVGKLSDEK